MSEKKISKLLAKKRQFFEVLLELSETEADLSLSELIPVLEQKKVLLSCIEEIDQKLEPFQASLSVLPQEIQEELEEMRQMLKRILHLDALHQESRKAEVRQGRERYSR